MLPPAHRMRRSREFTRAIRLGRRSGQQSLVIHSAPGPVDRPTHVGLIVGKAVGNAVVRHRVARRLRAVLAQQMKHSAAQWASGHLIVVRATPAAATRTSAELAGDLERAWRGLAARPGPSTRDLVPQR